MSESKQDKNKSKTKTKICKSLQGKVLIALIITVLGISCYGYLYVGGIKKEITVLKEFADTSLRDTTAIMQKAELELLVNRSTDRALDTYISSQGTLLGIVAFIIAVLTIIVPHVLNDSFRASNEEWYKKRVEEFDMREQDIKEEVDRAEKTIEDNNKVLDETKNEFNIKIAQAKEQIDDKIAKINGNLLGLSNFVKQIEKDYDQILINSLNENEYGEKIDIIIHGEECRNDKIAKLEQLIHDINGKVPASGYFGLGEMLFEEKEYEKAINNFESAIDKNPYFVEAFRSLAELYLEINNLNLAWKSIEKAIDLRENDYCLHDIRRRVFFEMGACQDAKKDAELCIKLANNENKTISEDNLKKINERIESEEQEQKENEWKEIQVDEDITVKMIKVPKGAFTMGATDEWDQEAFYDEKPSHRVLLDTFYIGSTVVTQALWEKIMEENPSHFKGKGELPVENISFENVRAFLEKLNDNTLNSRPEGMEFRLPTEAEWEYAARGGNKSNNYKYSGSDTLEDVAWFGDKSENKTHPVKKKRPNELGLYDMSGNVWEICEDYYNVYSRDCQINPRGPKEGNRHVCRGGSWKFSAGDCRVLNRGYLDNKGYSHIGFRLILSHKKK